MNYKQCPICQSKQLQTVIATSTDYISKDVFDVMQCVCCQVSFTCPCPEDIEQYYPKQYRKYSKLVLRVLRYFYQARVQRWSRLFDKPGHALEVGCGPGIMLDILQRQGWQVKGLERSEQATEYARNVYNLDVVGENIENLSLNEKYDLIILFNVLEHITDPLTLIRECAKRLNPHGRVIVNVPNFDSWQAKWFRDMWLHLDVPRHLFHFSKNSLQVLFNQAGLTIDSESYISIEHGPYGLIDSLVSKIFCHQNILTSYLMGLERFNVRTLLAITVAGAVAIPAGILALVSWFVKKGALIQVVGSLK